MELLSIRKYRKENEWGTKKVVKRDAIFLTLDLLGDHQWPSSSSFAACELFWHPNSRMRINYSFFFFFFFYDVFLLFSSPSLDRRISLSLGRSLVSAELSSIRTYKKENEWGTKKFSERDAIFLTLDVLGDHQWPFSPSFAACGLFWQPNSCMRLHYFFFFFFFFYDFFFF